MSVLTLPTHAMERRSTKALDEASMFMVSGDWEKAFPILTHVCESSPMDYRTHLAMVGYMDTIGEYADAELLLEMVTQGFPMNPDIAVTWVYHYTVQDKFNLANSAMQRLIALTGGMGKQVMMGTMNLSGCMLKRKAWKDGWTAFEQGFFFGQRTQRATNMPYWDGKEHPHKTLYVYHDQGIGDTILWARWLPQIKERFKGEVILDVQQSLSDWAQQWEGPDKVGTWAIENEPEADYRFSLLSAPYVLGLSTDDDMKRDAYLPMPEVERTDDTFRVGLCWRGGDGFRLNRHRSIPWSEFKHIINVPNVEFYSFQIGKYASECGDDIHRIDHEITDFSDTVGWLAQMDLLISVDTSVLNAAGAIGLPSWGLLWNKTEWRWGQPGEQGLFYPAVRTLWQEQPREWSGVLEKVRSDLQALVG